MTLLIGIVCRDGIVMASDSRMIEGSVILQNPRKIRDVRFSGGTAIIGQTGFANPASHAIDLIVERSIRAQAVQLPKIAKSVMGMELATVFAIKAIKDVLAIVQDCGGPIKVKRLHYPSGWHFDFDYVELMSSEDIDEISAIIRQTEEKTKRSQVGEFHELLHQRTAKLFGEMKKHRENALVRATANFFRQTGKPKNRLLRLRHKKHEN